MKTTSVVLTATIFISGCATVYTRPPYVPSVYEEVQGFSQTKFQSDVAECQQQASQLTKKPARPNIFAAAMASAFRNLPPSSTLDYNNQVQGWFALDDVLARYNNYNPQQDTDAQQKSIIDKCITERGYFTQLQR